MMLEGLKPEPYRVPCKIRTILNSLDETDKELLLGYLDDVDTWNDPGLAGALTTRGMKVSAKTLGRHRKRLCSC